LALELQPVHRLDMGLYKLQLALRSNAIGYGSMCSRLVTQSIAPGALASALPYFGARTGSGTVGYEMVVPMPLLWVKLLASDLQL